MTSELHGDHEETLRFLIGTLGNREHFEAMALETVWTTRMCVHYAVLWFVRASIMYAIRYDMAETADRLKQEFEAVEAELAEISKQIGAGL
jgi:hypothetical protein